MEKGLPIEGYDTHSNVFFNSLLKIEDKSNQCSTIIQNILGEEN